MERPLPIVWVTWQISHPKISPFWGSKSTSYISTAFWNGTCVSGLALESSECVWLEAYLLSHTEALTVELLPYVRPYSQESEQSPRLTPRDTESRSWITNNVQVRLSYSTSKNAKEGVSMETEAIELPSWWVRVQ